MDKKKIIEQMSLEDKAAFLTGKDFWQMKDFPELGVPSLFLSDGPHGLRKQAAAADHLGLNASIPATCFPTAATMANGWNEELGEEMGRALGEEAASMDVNVLLGPGTCMKRNPRCGRNFEYFSEDPYLAGKMSAAYIRGIQANGTSACVKHFACNNQEERRMSSDSVLDERTLRELYLTAFEIAVKEGKTKALMSSYNKINGVYANENRHVLHDILRDEWGYEGVVVTDWAGCNSRVEGIKCGNELEMPACKYGIDDVIKAVNDGELDIKDVDACVERLLTLVEQTTGDRAGQDGFDVQKHHLLAQKCAEESIVLLKNDGTLPINSSVKVALIGDFAENPRYQGAGSSIVNPTVLNKFVEITGKKRAPENVPYKQGMGSVGDVEIPVVETIVEDLGEYSLNVIGYEKGFDRYGKKNEKLIKSAVELANQAEVVLLFLGLDEVAEAEGLDREHLKLNDNQIELYKALKATGKKIAIVLACGSAVELDWADDCNALVYACLSGQACADAIMNVVTGAVNPSGKLAETFPVRYEDCPSASHFPGTMRTVEYREGLYVGYRYYDTAGVKTQYPFGFGLSYTTFEYSGLEVTEDGVTFTVTNTGKVDGKEVTQLYIGKEDAEVFRPKKELKGYKKVFVKAGESVKVSILFDDKTFRYFNVKTDKWEIEGGEYQVYIGASVEDIRLQGKTEQKGTGAPNPYDKEKLASYYSGQVANVGDEEFVTLLGREIPKADFDFYKKKRMVIDENSTVSDLRYSRGWTGRFFSWCIRFAIGAMRAFGNRSGANTLVMGMLHQPVRGMAKFTGMSRRQMEGLLLMFNGHFFKGAGHFLTKGKQPKKEEEAKA